MENFLRGHVRAFQAWNGQPRVRHTQAFEFQYMTAGLAAYLDMTKGEEYVFRKGDFYAIEPGVVYAQKSAPGTEILFIKVHDTRNRSLVSRTD